MTIDNSRWRCFLALEEELIMTQNFVEFNKGNYNTFSLKFRSIIMQACAEIEITFKEIIQMRSKEHADISKFRELILKHHNDFCKITILLPLYSEALTPWSRFPENKSPEFWSAYNSIKHSGEITKATLENAINSLAGLFALLLACYFKNHGSEFSGNDAISLPKLYSFPGLEPTHMVTENSYKVDIPGF